MDFSFCWVASGKGEHVWVFFCYTPEVQQFAPEKWWNFRENAFKSFPQQRIILHTIPGPTFSSQVTGLWDPSNLGCKKWGSLWEHEIYSTYPIGFGYLEGENHSKRPGDKENMHVCDASTKQNIHEYIASSIATGRLEWTLDVLRFHGFSWKDGCWFNNQNHEFQDATWKFPVLFNYTYYGEHMHVNNA